MITIRLGNFPFRIPQRWQEVTFQQAQKLFNTEPNDLRGRISAITSIPDARYLKLSESVVLAVYELMAFVEEVPKLTANKRISAAPLDWVSTWSFAEFETARQMLSRHINAPALAMAPLASIRECQQDYIEAGAKAIDGVAALMMHYEAFAAFDQSEPEDIEYAAGIERLQLFGVYPIIESIAAKFGKLPSQIEQEPVGWVLKEWVHTKEKEMYQVNLQKLSK